MKEVENALRYEIRITEEEQGWSVSGIIYRVGFTATFALGGLERIITYQTKEQAFDSAKEAIETLKGIHGGNGI